MNISESIDNNHEGGETHAIQNKNCNFEGIRSEGTLLNSSENEKKLSISKGK